MQTLHKTLHKLHISLIIQTLRNVGFMFQTLHKSYTRTYTKAFKNYTQTQRKSYTETDTNATQNPTQKRSKTIHKTFHRALINYTHPQHFGFEHETREMFRN